MTLDDYLETQTKTQLITIMHNALDLMQQYSGRSIHYCIVEGAGGEAIEQDDGTYVYKIPKK